MYAPVAGNAGPQNVVVATFDDVNGVDLHVAELLHRSRRCRRPLAERRQRVEPLGAQPDPPGRGLGQGMGSIGAEHRAGTVAGFARQASAQRFGRSPILPVAVSGSQEALPRSAVWHL